MAKPAPPKSGKSSSSSTKSTSTSTKTSTYAPERERSSSVSSSDPITRDPSGGDDNNSGNPPGGGQQFGCTNPSALNYNPYATIDDGTCELPSPAPLDDLITSMDYGIHPNPAPDEVAVIPHGDGCKPPANLCGDGQAFYEDSTSSSGYRRCDDCSEVSPYFHPDNDDDDDGVCKPPVNLCGNGQSYYEDSTSSTGYRSCSDCSEVSPHLPDNDSETIHGDPIVLIPTNIETEFTGQFHQPMTISFNEQAKGWVAFKTFYPEQALSINNHYYTYVEGSMWQHHINPRRNNFYGVDANSTVDVIFNDAPSSVKGFQTIKYEGSQSRINKFVTVVQDGVTYTDKEYYNLWEKCGWYVSYAETDLQTGKVPEFLNREGKWFNVIKGDCTTLENLDEQEFSVQGLGFATMTHSDPSSADPRDDSDKGDGDGDTHGDNGDTSSNRVVYITVKDSGSDVDGTAWD